VSHGFRPNRSSHTALNQIKTKWTGLYWFIESDIEKAFDQIHRNVLINLLKKKVKDQRLLDLIRKMFNCKILAPENFYFKNDKGVPQGNVLSSLLCNIYLHELDFFMEELMKKYKKGSNPTRNDIYYKKLELTKYERILSNEMQENRTRSKRRQLFNQGIKPYLHDGNFIRVRYIRYADDILIGVRGPKLIAEKIKNEITNWLKSNLHLNLKEKKTKLTFAIGNKINFLGFQLYKRAYNQLPYRNSRRIEKLKRIKARLLSSQDNTRKQLSKRLRFDLTKIIQQKMKLNNKATIKKVTNELGDVLVNILGDKVSASSPYRKILRQLEYELAEVILNDTNEKIKTVLAHLVNPDFLDPVKFVENNRKYRMQRDITLVSKTKLSEAEFARRFTCLLKENGYEHYKNKDEKKIRFDESIRKYLRANNIKLTYYPTEISLDAKVAEQLIPMSKTRPKKGALVNNYKTLIDYFFKLQNTVSPESALTKAQSQNSKARLKVLETKEGSLMDLPINIRVNWEMIIKRLKSRGFLNKKGRPSSVARLMTLTVPELVKYFRSVLCGYLTYYQCVDDFKSVKSRFYWYFKYSLVSTIKAKLKLEGRGKVFKRYGSDIKCLDSKGKEINFIRWEEAKKLKRTFLINLPEENPDKFLNTTWISTQNKDFIFDGCAVKGCANIDDIQIHHIRHLQRNGSQNLTIIQGRKNKLKSWEAISAAQKAKQLPLCGNHHNLLHQGKLNLDLIDESYLINRK
jgi:retron-type reverse transcriptase